MFPEGTRTEIGQNTPYRQGVGRLAIEINRPIVPVSLNSGFFWPEKSWIKHPGVIDVVISAPIVPQTPTGILSVRELMEALKQQIENGLKNV
jgi:1-acyl-sn-glycerol-3-phosphate acyltransferase